MAMQVFEQQQAVQQKSHDEHLLKDVVCSFIHRYKQSVTRVGWRVGKRTQEVYT